MRTNKERDEFLTIAEAEGLPESIARKLMRYATTLQRLAEAECNGDDWRDERGPRHYVNISEPGPMQTKCGESLVTPENVPAKVRSSKRWSAVTCSTCRSMRLEEIARRAVPAGFEVLTQGDPRGAFLKITVPSGRTNDWGRVGVCVP